MMLNLYRRHLHKCPHRAKGRDYMKCKCPVWCSGELAGKTVRRSLGLRDWSRAVKRMDQWEAKPTQLTAPSAVAGSIDSYLADCRARNLRPGSVRSYSQTLARLLDFCARADIQHMDRIDLDVITEFRASRPIKPSTSGKELRGLRAFCAFAVKRGWMPVNYARELKAPKEDALPTLPFDSEEVDRILLACDQLGNSNIHAVERTRSRARALCLTLLYSGMRISDTVQLKRAAVDLDTGKLLLRVMKTGAPLYVRMGAPATDALRALDGTGEYFFWNGESKLATAIGTASKTIDRVLRIAGMKGHPHRFRDTFSVALLEKGEELRTVQLLLGHTSIKTTEKHYAPWVKSMQRILDAATAKLDFGTRGVHGEKPAGKLLKMQA
jgi:integrase/recombinase XerD